MKKVTKKNYLYLDKLIEWFIYMVGYTLVFILVTSFFKSIYIDENHLILWSFIIVFITYILNITIKPILVTLTIPITGLTLGLFYPCINVFDLKLIDWALGRHFNINNLIIVFFVAIILSITNFIMEKIIKNILKKVKKNG